MSLKEKMKKVLEKLVEELELTSIDTDEEEYNATLEDHEVTEKNYYRLHYLNYHNINRDPYRRGEIDCPYKPFELPTGMKKEDAYKVLSYLTDFIEKRPEVYEASWKSVSTLDSVLNLERFGFKRPDLEPSDDEITDLFTIDGRVKRFKGSEYYSKYFNWYTPNIRKEEVEEIYKKCGMTFSDIIWLDEQAKKESTQEQNNNKLTRRKQK